GAAARRPDRGAEERADGDAEAQLGRPAGDPLGGLELTGVVRVEGDPVGEPEQILRRLIVALGPEVDGQVEAHREFADALLELPAPRLGGEIEARRALRERRAPADPAHGDPRGEERPVGGHAARQRWIDVRYG